MLRYLTAGESHGRSLTAIIEGIPANLSIDSSFVNRDLARRQKGYGRGGRMKIESDRVEILSGVRNGKTIGSPITLLIENRDWENWQAIMNADPLPPGETGTDKRERVVTRPRPGHADLTGAIKYNQRDIRNILERSSARETAARVAAGAVAKRFLQEFSINVYSWVAEIGGVKCRPGPGRGEAGSESDSMESVYYSFIKDGKTPAELFLEAESSEVRCPDGKATEEMKKKIDQIKESGNSAGGVFEVIVTGLPEGIGAHIQNDRKLDAALAAAMVSIQAIKGVEIGYGFAGAGLPGSEVHDEIFYSEEKIGAGRSRFFRNTNRAGGIEGGMSNGEDVVIRAAMKPIPTLYKPLRSVDIETKEAYEASVERSDVCAVPAAAVVGEAVCALTIAEAFLAKFAGDSVEETKRNYNGYIDFIERF